jgi:hypothetical protein
MVGFLEEMLPYPASAGRQGQGECKKPLPGKPRTQTIALRQKQEAAA